jgi:hypothetical protein
MESPAPRWSESFRAMESGQRALICLSISYPILLTLFYLGTLANRMDYAYGHLFLNYSHGFARRSLYGTLFQSIPFISARMALLLGYCQVLIAIVLTYAMFARHFLGSFREMLLFCFFFGGCGLLPHLGLIYGYLDVPLFSLLLITVFIIQFGREYYALTLIPVSALTVIGLLIHEAYLLMFYPAVLFLLLLRMKPGKSSALAFLLHCAFVACAFCFIILHGNVSIDPKVYFELSKARTDAPISSLAFNVMQGSFRQQFDTAVHFYLRPTTLLFMAVSVLSALPYLLVLWTFLSALVSEAQPQNSSLSRWVKKLMPFLLAAPLLLTMVGFDFMRWLSSVCIDITIVAAFQFCFASNRDQIRSAFGRIAEKNWFVSGLLASMIIGPFGVVMGNRLTERLFLFSSSLGIHWGWRP